MGRSDNEERPGVRYGVKFGVSHRWFSSARVDRMDITGYGVNRFKYLLDKDVRLGLLSQLREQVTVGRYVLCL